MPISDVSPTAAQRLAKTLCGVLLAFCVNAVAEPFNVEMSLSYDRTELSTSSPLFIFPVPPVPVEPSRVETGSDTDTTGLLVTWFYEGASAADGPLSRAAFVSRASSLSLSVAAVDTSTRFRIDPPPVVFSPLPLPTPVPPLPPGPIVIDLTPSISPIPLSVDGTAVALGGRHIFKGSGWYLFGSLAFDDADIEEPAIDGSVESRRLLAGVGKYLGATSSLDLAVLRIENELRTQFSEIDDTATELLLTFTHIADLSSTWQYGLDISVSTLERFGEDGSVDLRASLFPGRSLALGLDIGTSIESAFDDGTRYGLFVSWFATPTFELFAQAGTSEPAVPPGIVADEDSYGVGIRARF